MHDGHYSKTDPVTCHACGERIEWGPILTRPPGCGDYIVGSCRCGPRAWCNAENYGRWDRYYYSDDRNEELPNA